jgi:hypothetical protein
VGGQIIFFAEYHRQTSAGRISCDASTINAAAYDEHIAIESLLGYFHVQ